MFIAGKIFAFLVFPPGLFLLLLLAGGILGAVKKRGAALGLLLLDFALIYILSANFFSDALLAPLENKYPPLADAKDCRAVVVLGGGYNDVSPERGGGPSLSPEAEARAVYGLELARLHNLPLVYSGGAGYDLKTKTSEAEAAGALWRSLGFPKDRITLEDKSLDTKMNAAGVAAALKGEKIVLVTSAYHMPRAMFAFQKAGLRPVPAPTDYETKRSPRTWTDYMPSVSALKKSLYAAHEFIGMLYYRLTLR